MERLTDSNKEIPTLDDNVEYWLKVYFKLKDYEDLEQRRKLIKKIAEMFLKAFDDSEEKISCNCQHNSNSRDNEPCCRCDSRQTNADRIRNMSDEELAEFLCKVKSDYQWMEHEFPSEEEHGEWEEWLQSEAE